MPALNIYRLSESAVTIQFGDGISEDTLNIITAYNKLLHNAPFPGFVASTPAYVTLSVFFDYFIVHKSTALTGNRCFEKVSNYLYALHEKLTESDTPVSADIIEIPVCYEDDFAVDIKEVSVHTGLSVNDIVLLHPSRVYLVHMIGFIPGFAYLGGMDEQLSAPRKEKVNPTVPAGSVGIAGEQTGIYPIDTPGGWQIIGRTPVSMFDTGRQQPAYLKPGDRVRFKSITMAEFEQYDSR